ncbi:AI-2E family transporter [Janthinobacterium sp. GW460P]|uniref:AI-2E family transporter n=1 Tax=unclassified Janthinobacterium TaxID=2610881 RepID=UPI001482C9F5|nr:MULTISPECIES: AI-2E family transporter [unclassified Janthinobacterium]MCC7706047.1 AI-2E family transporter [Janthinobacterium sp. GW460P]MCC7711549.1 AI-2E family transporter [Janthinobacterium sp. GW460W]
MKANFALTAACVLAILYFSQDVLQPIVTALVLSLALAPVIRAMGRLGLSRVHATFGALALVIVAFVGAFAVLGANVMALSSDLPQYSAEIRAKTRRLEQMVQHPLARLAPQLIDSELAGPLPEAGPRPLPVEIRERVSTSDSIAKAIGVVSGPLGEAFLILVLLIFILLDRQNLRDRVLRLVGQRDVSRTIQGLEDAAEGVSRFFFTQLVLNVTFGVVIGLALWLIGIPHAALWGSLCGALRFVPYIGALIAGAAIALFSAAVDPGWTLAVYAMMLFLLLELLVAHVVEPRVYGQSVGMSPLAVIVSALFWGAIWGPLGLLLSTPLTLCIVVAGRYIKSLEPISILFSEAPHANAAQRFHHRVLSGEADAIIDDAHAFLRKATLAHYCDKVMLPGLALASSGMLSSQKEQFRATVAMVADTLAAGQAKASARTRRISLLNENIGAHLRQRREERLGRWQGSLDVPARSVILSTALPGMREEFMSELLVLVLREAGLDARSYVLRLDAGPEDDPGADQLISTVFIAYPLESGIDAWAKVVTELRSALPDVPVATIRPREAVAVEPAKVAAHVDLVLQSFEEALAFVAPRQPA